MKNTYKHLLYLLTPLIVLVAGSCGDDEEASAYLERKPTIIDISVANGLRGAEITLNGINFESVNQVKFGNVEAEFSKTATSISTKVPDEVETGELNIAIYGSNGSDRIAFVALVEPTITEISHTEALPGTEIAITGENLNWVNIVTLGGVSIDFVATETEISISLPMNAIFGEVEIAVSTRGGTDVALIDVLSQPVINSVSSMSGEEGKEILIEGINLVDVQAVKIGESEARFVVNGPTELVFEVPAGAVNGMLTVTTATGSISTEEDFTVITITEVPRIVIFEEVFIGGWENGGWGSVRNYENEEQPLNGNYAIKVNYEGVWGGLQIFPKPTAFDLTGYESITLSVYGDPAAGGNIQLYIKGSDGETYGPKTLDVVLGSYKTFVINLSELGSPADISELVLQDTGTENNLVYVDAIVLK